MNCGWKRLESTVVCFRVLLECKHESLPLLPWLALLFKMSSDNQILERLWWSSLWPKKLYIYKCKRYNNYQKYSEVTSEGKWVKYQFHDSDCLMAANGNVEDFELQSWSGSQGLEQSQVRWQTPPKSLQQLSPAQLAPYTMCRALLSPSL